MAIELEFVPYSALDAEVSSRRAKNGVGVYDWLREAKINELTSALNLKAQAHFEGQYPVSVADIRVSERQRNTALAVAMIVPKSTLYREETDRWALSSRPIQTHLGLTYPLCATEPYSTCECVEVADHLDNWTGAYVGKEENGDGVLLTCAHGFEAIGLEPHVAIFGLSSQANSGEVIYAEKKNIFACTSVIAKEISHAPYDADWAKIRLKGCPAVDPLTIASLPMDWRINPPRLYAIGHPMGLAQKITAVALPFPCPSPHVSTFVAPLDAYPGNSGSPILLSTSGEDGTDSIVGVIGSCQVGDAQRYNYADPTCVRFHTYVFRQNEPFGTLCTHASRCL